MTKCRACGGTGDSNPLRPEGVVGWSPCPECGGDGHVDELAERVESAREGLQDRLATNMERHADLLARLAGESAPEQILLTPEEWCAITGWVVMDADGWRGRNTFSGGVLEPKDWSEPLTYAEFSARVVFSSGRGPWDA